MRALNALFVLLFGMLAACAGETAAAGPCAERVFENDRFTVCAFDPEAQALRLAWRGADGEAYRGFDALARGMDQTRVAFAMNAGMFDRVGAPIGLLVESGRELHAISTTEGPGNFHLKPNGVFWIDDAGAPHVAATDSYLALTTSPEWATQSGPMLLIDGTLHPAFDNDGVSRHIRNGVGVGDGGEAWFVISEQPVSFGKLARFFRDSLAADNALYLDGAVSSLWDPRAGRMDKGVPLGPLVVVCSPSC
jgi:uncharacterized protein YigE (DUF2233 family)